jgi:hypothetical protein
MLTPVERRAAAAALIFEVMQIPIRILSGSQSAGSTDAAGAR